MSNDQNQYLGQNQEDNYYNQVDDNDNVFSMNKVDVRVQFIRKVYLILSTQLLITAGMSTAAVFSNDVKTFIINNIWLFIVSIFLNLFSCYGLVCYKSCSRTVPNNYILLSIFTLSESYMLMAITGFSYPENVFIALVLTAAIVVSLTIYAFTTKTDFTICGGMLFMLLMTLLVASILSFFMQSRVFDIIISACSVFLFGIYLIFDTQLIVGKHENKLSLDDYILGALMLYIDIIRIFLEILKILNQINRS